MSLYRISFFIVFISLLATTLHAQEEHEFGNPTPEERNMTVYKEDPDAEAVVLYEKGDYSYAIVDEKLRLVKKVYRKIKILTDEAKDLANFSIRCSYSATKKERISKLRGVTTNKQQTLFLDTDDVYTKSLSNQLTETTFTFPNVQKGSVLEYEYTIHSPFFFNLGGWSFQNNIPTKYSEFFAEIPGIFKYNRSLFGKKKLDVNESKIKENCFYPSANRSDIKADCEVMHYVMKNIPAFHEEDYMLSKYNYLSRIHFELEQTTSFQGNKTYYTKDWKTVDKEFKRDKNIGGQSRKNNFFKKQLPEEIRNISDDLEKANAVYSFIQKHLFFNNRYGIFQEADVKKAFKDKKGSAAEINLALINALQAVDLDAEIALISTRDHGFPTKKHAIISEFNYIAVYLAIGDKNYFLDATDKDLPFGMLPFSCLNHEARIMDFKNGSYWEPIVPEDNSMNYTNAQLQIDDDYTFKGKLRESNAGYNALAKRKELKEQGLEEYLRQLETQNNDLEITNHKITDLKNIENPVTEDFEVILHNESANNVIFNPFIFTSFSKNPFQLDERTYPVDFGHPIKYTYMLSLDLSDKYELVELPENKSIKFPDGAGETTVVYQETNGVIQMRFQLQLMDSYFEPEAYESLKAFFDLAVKAQNNNKLVLKKI